jgi:tetratricopeptide (TPR) repeat protein
MYAYNPRKKPYRQLERTLVGSDRWDILNNILQELAIKEGEVPKQHWMIVGPRGIGKSHLMTLLYYKIKKNKELNNLWIPILFPEDLRMAGNLSRFLERTVSEILLEFEQEKNQISDELKRKIIKVRKVPISERVDSFFSLISWFHQKTGKFILLITENLQQLLGKKIPLIEQKKLRAFLQTSDALLIIGSATTIFNALHDHSHPFYHFFHIRRLEDLEFEDMKTLIVDLLSESGRPELIKEVAGKDVRLKTLYTFTGGNPRMAVFLSDVLRTEVPDEMLSFMDNILDELTPYFEAILKDIPDSLEDIINTLAAFEPAQSPKEIAQHLEAPQATIRNYLKQLKENGYVRIAFSKGKSNYYCLNEYLYRIWYQMRDSSHREETRWLMELLLMLYSPSSIIEEKNKIDAYLLEEKPVFSYKKLIVQTADFLSHNPGYCKIIELCADSTINDKKRTIVHQKEKELLEEAFNYRKNNQYEKAIELCDDILKINPKSEIAFWHWGDCLRDQERYEEAIGKFKEAIKIDPESYLAYGAMGDCFRGLGQYDEAEKYYKKAININPKYDDAYGAWGACLRDQERYEDAIEKFKETIKIDPESYSAYGAMGDCYRELGQYDEAEKQYKKAVKIEPKYEDAYGAWGDCLRDQKRYEEAIEKFKEAIKINPKAERAYWAWGDCLRDQERYKEAIEKCKKVIEINPKSEYAYWLWGDCLWKQEYNDEAISLFEKHFPESKDSDVIYSYGSSLMGAERYDEALKQFEHIIKIEPEYHNVYLSYGQLLEKMNDSELALLAYLKHINLGCDAISADFDFHKIHNDYILPLINTLKPSDYVKYFYALEKEKKFSEPQLSIFLILLAKYDTASEHFQDVISAYREKDDKEKEDFNLLMFTIKLSIWLKLCEGNLHDVLRLTDLYIEYIKSLKNIAQKENEVSNFSLNLFKIQINSDIDSKNIRNILQRFKEQEDVPFSDIFFKIWTCLNEPDSIEAQRFLNEKAIAEVVKELNNKQSSAHFICDLLSG